MNVQRHMAGIKPSGNWTKEQDVSRQRAGHFSVLPDEIVLHLLQALTVDNLVYLSHTCKWLYAFSLSEELWKEIYTQSNCQKPWRGTWRNSVLGLTPMAEVVQVPDVYSDVLFKPYFNTQIDLNLYLPNRRSTLIPRYADLSLSDFQEKHTHRPFILTKAIKDWPALKSWTIETLVAKYSQTKFRAECVDWPLSEYVEYMRCNQDESPLYLFDSHFAEKSFDSVSLRSLADDYTIPECFDEDRFKILAKERPDHRWLILGPARSGSTFHKDPNGTCAWNAVITGAKLWIMLPPDCPPPGVYVSADESEVTSPLSIAEWLLTYHAAARETKGFMEGICGPGEILYVPSGWWHLVVNLDECIAVTQNFVPKAYVGKVLRFLRDKGDQVSGFCKKVKPYEVFRERLETDFPDELIAATRVVQGTWDTLRTGEDETTSTDFVFGFHENDLEDEERP